MSIDNVLNSATEHANELWIAANRSKQLPVDGLHVEVTYDERTYDVMGGFSFTFTFFKEGRQMGTFNEYQSDQDEFLQWLFSRSINGRLKKMVEIAVSVENQKQVAPVQVEEIDAMDFTKMEDNLARAVRFIAGRIVPVSVMEDVKGKVLIASGNNAKVVEVPEVLDEAAYDKWAQIVYPERHDRLFVYKDWEAKNEIFVLANKIGTSQIVSLKLHPSENALMVELGDKTEFAIMQSESLGQLWRAVEKSTDLGMADAIYQGYKAVMASRKASQYDTEQAALSERWHQAIERSGADVDKDDAGVLIDADERKLFVLVADEIVGKAIECPADEDFREWLNNGRKFGKAMRNIADAELAKTEPETEIEEIEEMQVVEPVVVEHVVAEDPVSMAMKAYEMFKARMDAEVAEVFEKARAQTDANPDPVVVSEELAIYIRQNNIETPAIETLQEKWDRVNAASDAWFEKARKAEAERLAKEKAEAMKAEADKALEEAIAYAEANAVPAAEVVEDEPEFDPYNDPMPEPAEEPVVEPEPVVEAEAPKAERKKPEHEKSVLYTEAESKAIRRKAIGRVFTALAKYGDGIDDEFGLEIQLKINQQSIGCGYDVDLTIGTTTLCLFQGSEDECIKWLSDTAASGKVFRQAIKHVSAGGDASELDGEMFDDDGKHPFLVYGVGDHQMEFLSASEKKLAEKINEADADWMKLEHLKKLNERVAKRVNKKNMSKRTKGVIHVPGMSENEWAGGGYVSYVRMLSVVDYAGNGELEYADAGVVYTFNENTTEAACLEAGGMELVAEWHQWMKANNVLPF